MDDSAAFARLIQALRPWLGHLVIAGGWAHRLHRLHPLAGVPAYAPLRTRDVDVALSLHAPVDGDLRRALEDAGFMPEYSGDNRPPVTQYALTDDDAGFYAEFLVPLLGGEVKRDGSPDVTILKSGINAQKLRHLDLLLVRPGRFRSVQGGQSRLRILSTFVPNPVSFIVQKGLIHEKRKPGKKPQDVLYIHDTLELFGAALDDLRSIWKDHVRPTMPARTAKRAEDAAHALFERVTDPIRDAARIPQDRTLQPEVLRAACAYGISEILGGHV